MQAGEVPATYLAPQKFIDQAYVKDKATVLRRTLGASSARPIPCPRTPLQSRCCPRVARPKSASATWRTAAPPPMHDSVARDRACAAVGRGESS